MKISLRAPNFTKITGNATKALPDASTTLTKRSAIAPKGSQEGLIRLHEAFKTTAFSQLKILNPLFSFAVHLFCPLGNL